MLKVDNRPGAHFTAHLSCEKVFIKLYLYYLLIKVLHRRHHTSVTEILPSTNFMKYLTVSRIHRIQVFEKSTCLASPESSIDGFLVG